MNDRRGSAVVLAMLLLVLFSAIGMYAVSLPYSGSGTRPKHALETIAGNMARAGAHAAIARLPEVIPQESPYVRRFPVGRTVTGKYEAISRRTAAGEFTVQSVGTVDGAEEAKRRVRAVVRYPSDGVRGRILRWEETGLP
jgi:hypothetical protein